MNKSPRFIADWKKRLKKSWTVYAAVFGAGAPQLLQILADRTGELPWLDAGWKSLIQTTCLMAIPLLVILKQNNLAAPQPKEGSEK
jgi:hypothetical protein